MPYVIRHKQTGQIFSCKLINIHGFEYYGIKSWEDLNTAEKEWVGFLRERGTEAPREWELSEVDEHQHKMCNVRLGNNASRRVYIDGQGRIETKTNAEKEENG